MFFKHDCALFFLSGLNFFAKQGLILLKCVLRFFFYLVRHYDERFTVSIFFLFDSINELPERESASLHDSSLVINGLEFISDQKSVSPPEALNMKGV